MSNEKQRVAQDAQAQDAQVQETHAPDVSGDQDVQDQDTHAQDQGTKVQDTRSQDTQDQDTYYVQDTHAQDTSNQDKFKMHKIKVQDQLLPKTRFPRTISSLPFGECDAEARDEPPPPSVWYRLTIFHFLALLRMVFKNLFRVVLVSKILT
jgi:hypothetical protein